MGRAADGQVLAAGPVEVVVAALVAGLGPVRDLVPLVARGPEPVGGELVLVGLGVVVGMAGGVGGERGAGLHRQGVGAHVVRIEGDGRVEGGRPLVEGLAGGAVHEVDVHRQTRGVSRLHRPTDVGRVVLAPEGGQHGSVHRLDADGDPGDPSLGVDPSPFGVEVVGVALDGDLRPRRQRHGSEHSDQAVRVDQRRRSAADEDAGHRWPARSLLTDLALAGGQVALLQVEAVGPGREGAVVAPVPAEGHVEVEPERHARSVPVVRSTDPSRGPHGRRFAGDTSSPNTLCDIHWPRRHAW